MRSRTKGIRVVEARDGLDALECLRAAPTLPELILLDLMMPRMNGLELRQALLEVEAWAAIPVVVVTADANARKKLERLAIQGFLQKPATLDQLYGAVARALEAVAPPP